MSEKLDGVRAYWDGTQLLSRLGNPFKPPAWFADPLPKEPLDGELWVGRKQFQKTVGIVRRQDQCELWREVRDVVFDAPGHPGPFEERLRHLEVIGTGCGAHVVVHPHEPCRGQDHLRTELARVEALGGEGLMLRKPGSKYEVGRSFTLLKVKTFHDAEARVLAHVAGAGKHAGRLGSLLAQLPDGTEFNVGTGFSDAERESPPPVGSIITFRYQELSDGGVPRFPSYVGVRDDFRWPGDGVSVPRPAPTAPALRVRRRRDARVLGDRGRGDHAPGPVRDVRPQGQALRRRDRGASRGRAPHRREARQGLPPGRVSELVRTDRRRNSRTRVEGGRRPPYNRREPCRVTSFPRGAATSSGTSPSRAAR
jgi:hypothetical protein